MVRETAFDEVFDSQATFRVMLDCLSRPGNIRTVPARPYELAPAEFCPSVLSLLKTVCDHRVSFSIGSPASRPDWVAYLEMNLSTPFRQVNEAEYALFEGGTFDPDFSRLNRGRSSSRRAPPPPSFACNGFRMRSRPACLPASFA